MRWITGKKGFWAQCIYDKDTGYLVAKVINRKREEEVINEDDKEILTNARLIATTPELLEVCYLLINGIEMNGKSNSKMVTLKKAYDKAKQVIQKTERSN